MRVWSAVGLVFLSLMLIVGCGGRATSFSDDFSDPASGWGAASTETYVRGYDSGRYLIRLDVPNWFVWVTGGYTYRDVSLEATIRSEGAVDNHYGLICRAGEQGFYYFAVSADGYYAIFRHHEDGTLQPLNERAMVRSPLIHTGGASNRLLAVCEGTTLTLYVNGERVAQVEDATLQKGDVGMAAGTARGASTTLVWFDDLKVTEP
ncbi:MAG: hypothetical protein ACP5HM_10870 [Anaerolineae bacterium]